MVDDENAEITLFLIFFIVVLKKWLGKWEEDKWNHVGRQK
jgi:predicted small integral membrane protein